MSIPTLINVAATASGDNEGTGAVAPDQRLAIPVQARAAGTAEQGHYAHLDDLRMYYEMHGTGRLSF